MNNIYKTIVYKLRNNYNNKKKKNSKILQNLQLK